jgi:hypothetical protein
MKRSQRIVHGLYQGFFARMSARREKYRTTSQAFRHVAQYRGSGGQDRGRELQVADDFDLSSTKGT